MSCHLTDIRDVTASGLTGRLAGGVSWGRGPGLLVVAAGRLCAPGLSSAHSRVGAAAVRLRCAARAALLLEDLCVCPDSSLLRGNSFSDASAQGDGSATVTCIGPRPQ